MAKEKQAPQAGLLSPLAADFTLFGGADAVLLIHGFTGSPAHMLKLGTALQQQGFTVRGVLLTGHGTRAEDMLKASWEDWLSDVREAYDAMAAAFRTVSVAGLSMGGVLSLILAAEKQPACCVTCSAPMGISNPFAGAAPLIGKILPLLPKRKKAADQLLDPDYDIGYDVIPTPRLTDLKTLIRMAKERLSGVRCPVLCAQSQKDPDISKDSADVILAGVSSARKEKLTLTQPLHVITIGPETDTLFPAVCRFMLDCTKENP